MYVRNGRVLRSRAGEVAAPTAVLASRRSSPSCSARQRIEIVALARSEHGCEACARVSNVIMLAVSMVDAVPAAPRSSTFQPDDLLHETRVIEQLNPAAIDGRQQVAVKVGLRPGRRLIPCATLLELLA